MFGDFSRDSQLSDYSDHSVFTPCIAFQPDRVDNDFESSTTIRGVEMNISYMADISDIMGSIGIVITLIFLVLQLRENTRAIKASTRQSARDADSQAIVSAIDNPGAILAWTKQDMTDEEAVQHTFWMTLFFRNRENDWFQYHHGVMDKDTWERYKSSITVTFLSERNRNWWNNIGTTVFNPDYVVQVNEILKRTPIQKEQVHDRFRAWSASPDEYKRLLNPGS